MKSIAIFIAGFLYCSLTMAQQYSGTAIKFATKADALPYGKPQEVQINVVLDLDAKRLDLSNFPAHCFIVSPVSKVVHNNGYSIRMVSECPQKRKCFVIVYIENHMLQTLEIRFVTVSYKYFFASH